MITPNRERLFSMWFSDLMLLFRAQRGPFFWLPVIVVGFVLANKVVGLSSLAPFLLFLLVLERVFSSMLNRYSQELKCYVVSGVNLNLVIFGKNLSLFSLGALGAVLSGFGLQWRSEMTLLDSILSIALLWNDNFSSSCCF